MLYEHNFICTLDRNYGWKWVERIRDCAEKSRRKKLPIPLSPFLHAVARERNYMRKERRLWPSLGPAVTGELRRVASILSQVLQWISLISPLQGSCLNAIYQGWGKYHSTLPPPPVGAHAEGLSRDQWGGGSGCCCSTEEIVSKNAGGTVEGR